MTHEKERWVLGPWIEITEPETEVVRKRAIVMDYALKGDTIDFEDDGLCLTYCRLNVHQLLALRQDSRFTVLPSVTADEPLPDHVVLHKAKGRRAGAYKKDMRLRELLHELGKSHPAYEPDR